MAGPLLFPFFSGSLSRNQTPPSYLLSKTQILSGMAPCFVSSMILHLKPLRSPFGGDWASPQIPLLHFNRAVLPSPWFWRLVKCTPCLQHHLSPFPLSREVCPSCGWMDTTIPSRCASPVVWRVHLWLATLFANNARQQQEHAHPSSNNDHIHNQNKDTHRERDPGPHFGGIPFLLMPLTSGSQSPSLSVTHTHAHY